MVATGSTEHVRYFDEAHPTNLNMELLVRFLKGEDTNLSRAYRSMPMSVE